MTALFRALVDPSADQSDLLGCEMDDGWQFFAVGSDVFAGFAIRGHGFFRVHTGDRKHERAFGALAGNDDGSIFAALHDFLERIHTETGFLFVFAMTAGAGFFEERSDVLGKSHVLLGGSGRQIGGIAFFLIRLRVITGICLFSATLFPAFMLILIIVIIFFVMLPLCLFFMFVLAVIRPCRGGDKTGEDCDDRGKKEKLFHKGDFLVLADSG